jgi:putative DNA primase/helicase
MRYDAQAIHAALGADGWVRVLRGAGIDESFLRNKHGPCPACGGKDRYRFDNRTGRGDWICGVQGAGCGAGDGFRLLMGALNINFSQARTIVMEQAGLKEQSDDRPLPAPRVAQPVSEPTIARPTQRVRAVLRESCLIEDCEAVRAYMESRRLWPLPPGHCLRAHPSVPYWDKDDNGQPIQVGRFAALVAPVRDRSGELVTVHVTYIQADGQKLQIYDPRKLLSPLTGREGCAVQMMAHGSILGVAEGIETALSAAVMHDVPVWPTINAGLLAKWEPPSSVDKVIIFADLDVAGLLSTAKLMERLQGRVRFELRQPTKGNDWNDAWRAAA